MAMYRAGSACHLQPLECSQAESANAHYASSAAHPQQWNKYCSFLSASMLLHARPHTSTHVYIYTAVGD